MSWGPSLETLRGLAVILVFLSHSLGHWSELTGSNSGILSGVYSLTFQVDFGRLGVYLFFLISGFLIPFTVRGAGWRPANDFLRRRFLRVAPLYFFSLPLGLILEHWLQGQGVSLTMALQNLLLIPNFFNNPFALNSYWTLQIELVFYLLIFTITIRFDFRKNQYVLPIAFLSTILLAEIIRPDRYAVGADAAIIIGELAKIFGAITFLWLGALLRNLVDNRLTKLEVGLLALYVFYAFVYLPCRYFKNIDMAANHPTLSFLVPALSLVMFYLVVSRGLTHIKLNKLGAISYSIYLLHAPVIYAVKCIFVFALSNLNTKDMLPSLSHGMTATGVFFMGLTFILTVWVSQWAYQKIECRFWKPTEHARQHR
jgi:peptidoglycan/LPS O-acetylase OafA/YrhL